MAITAEQVKALREKTGAGMMDCKKALAETGGDEAAAVEWLRKKGLSEAGKKTGRIAAEGVVASYIHPGGKVGVLIEINCQTDFVARGEEFQGFAKDIAMQVAAANPLYVRREEVPEALIAKEREIFKTQVIESGKPEKIADKIVDGKINKWFGEICLLEQAWVKDPKMTIEQLRAEMVHKTGENIQVRRFARFILGEGIEKKEENLAEEIAKMNAQRGA